MFIPVGKLIVTLIWAFWMLGVDSSLGEEYMPTYGSTFEKVMEAGQISCGTKAEFIGFSVKEYDEETGLDWHGFDVDICRAIAAALFGDKTNVDFVDVDGRTRFEYLLDGTIDVLSAATTYTFSRNVSKKLEFLPTTYYDGQGFITKRTLGVSSAKQMEGAKICYSSTGTAAKNLQAFLK